MSDSNLPRLTVQQLALRRRRRIILACTLAGLGLLAGAAVVGKKVIWPKYKAYQIRQINAEAAELLRKNDPINAMLLVRKSLQKSQINPEAWRLGAAASKERGQSEAIYYQNQLLKQEPTNENRLEMLRIAMAFEQYGLVLANGKEAAKDAANVPEYHEIMAAAYKKVGRPIAAKYHLEILCSLRPSDNAARLNLAAFEMENDRERKDKTLRSRVRSLADQPELRRQALGLLLREAVNNRLKVDGLELLSRMEATPGLDIKDRLLLVEATKLCRPSGLEEQIERLKKDFGSNETEVARIMDFLTAQGESARVKPWFDALPEVMKGVENIRRAAAEALFVQQNWEAMVEILQGNRWERQEYLRHALLSYAYRSRGLVTEYFENWKAATMEAGVDAKFCMDLLQRLEKWRWDSERYDIIWKLFHLFPDNEQLRTQLYAWELKNKNTPNLNRMFMRMIEIDPNDGISLSNFAYSSFLLNANIARAGLIAQQLYQLNPNDPYYVTLYSFSLTKQGKYEEAKKLMLSLRQSALSQPERMALLVNILAKVGDYERATELIAGIARNTLLPEEKNLIERAEDEIARGARTRELVSRVTAFRENDVTARTDGGWLALLQPETRASVNPSMQLANSLYMAGDLKGMAEILRDDDWDEHDYLRLALRAHSLRALSNAVQSSDSWRQALASAKRNQLALENLENLTARWDWQPERIQVLNALFEVTPNNRVLLAELMEFYRGKKKTADLTRLLETYLAEKNIKGDESIAYAYYCMLTGLNASQATVRAKDNFEAEPDNTDARYVQAFSLARQGRHAEAARILAETKGSTSALVSTPLIHALVAAGMEDNNAAEKALGELDKLKALPEELMVAEKAAATLRTRKPAGK